MNAKTPFHKTVRSPARSRHETIEKIKKLSTDAETPLQKIEYLLHLWVAFVIMPLLALANAGMDIGPDLSGLINPVSTGIIAGLLVGKFIGVFSFTWLLVEFGLDEQPEGAGWSHIAGVAILAGVGFTMSLFITGLAFEHVEMVDQANYGILIASAIAGPCGIILLRRLKPAS